jgi:hypothetical protein
MSNASAKQGWGMHGRGVVSISNNYGSDQLIGTKLYSDNYYTNTDQAIQDYIEKKERKIFKKQLRGIFDEGDTLGVASLGWVDLSYYIDDETLEDFVNITKKSATALKELAKLDIPRIAMGHEELSSCASGHSIAANLSSFANAVETFKTLKKIILVVHTDCVHQASLKAFATFGMEIIMTLRGNLAIPEIVIITGKDGLWDLL